MLVKLLGFGVARRNGVFFVNTGESQASLDVGQIGQGTVLDARQRNIAAIAGRERSDQQQDQHSKPNLDQIFCSVSGTSASIQTVSTRRRSFAPFKRSITLVACGT
jgi:hypothetical protein